MEERLTLAALRELSLQNRDAAGLRVDVSTLQPVID